MGGRFQSVDNNGSNGTKTVAVVVGGWPIVNRESESEDWFCILVVIVSQCPCSSTLTFVVKAAMMGSH